jgi:UDP-N-acetylglucosamine 2-epimerase
MMNSLTIVGTRPELIRLCSWENRIVFTGQHKDHDMGEQFLDKTKKIHYLPYNINHLEAEEMMRPIVDLIGRIGKPDYIISHGDTRSALTSALVAHKLDIILAHTEAGVRCFQDTVEERIRKRIDHLANYNFTPIPQANKLLEREGITQGVYYTGDLLYDTFLKNREKCRFVFVTIHRRENILDKQKLTALIDSLKHYPQVIFPVHPHTKQQLRRFGITLPGNVIPLSPLDHSQTLRYIQDAELVLTDSGGIQREAYWCGTPCKVARKQTEWGVATGQFGNGHAGDKMLDILTRKLPYREVPK